MKKILSLLIIVVTVFVIVPVRAAQGFPLVSVTDNAVNVRNGSGLSYKIQYQVSKGTILELISKERNSSGDLWFKVYDFGKNRIVYIASWLTDSSGISIIGKNADFTAEVTENVLNVRVGPGTSFPVKDVLVKGDKVHVTRIISRSDMQDWYRYEQNGKYFYIAGWYVRKIELKKTDDNGSAGKNTNSNARANYYINIRKGPSLDYGKLGLISKGDTMPIIGIAHNDSKEIWIEIQYKSITGWCYLPLFTTNNLPQLDLSPMGGNSTVIDDVNLRSGPSTGYSVEKVLSKDTSCIIVGVAKNNKNEIWYEVNVGKLGWIRSDLVNLRDTEKGSISNLTWKISPKGINVLIYGKNLVKPDISILENPIRLDLQFKNTILSKGSNALSINVLPIVRVRYSQKEFTSDVIVDLTNRIPFKADFENGVFVLQLELPVEGEKRVELSGSAIYAPVTKVNNTEYIMLKSVLDCFNTKGVESNGKIVVKLLDKNITISQKDTIKKDNVLYISLSALMFNFDVSVIDTGKIIYIDPILESFTKDKSGEQFVFSIPPKIKKDGSTYLLFADAGKFKSQLNCVSRNGAVSPEIKLQITNGQRITASGRSVIIGKSAGKKGILSGRIIVIDPGHGSYSGPYLDTGATGPTGVKEGAVVLEIAKKLRTLLEADGAKVILTHETLNDPHNPTLAQRCAIANNSGGDLFMSIHLNAAVSHEAHGTETYYWHSDSEKFAGAIQHSLVTELDTTNRGVKRDYLYVCRNVTTMPAILTEVVFVSNPHEESLCKQQSFLDKAAKALRDGIVTYLTNGG